MITPWPHQLLMAAEVKKRLEKYSIAYLAAEERTGKTLALILVCEELGFKKVGIVTKKKALKGWIDTLKSFPHEAAYFVTNFHKCTALPDDCDVIIIDEAHSYISSFPKPGLIWKEMKAVCANKPLLYASATPHAQSLSQLYHQFALSSYSPWKQFKTFYAWYKEFGSPYYIQVNGVDITQYDKTIDEVKEDTDHLFFSMTREEIGFEREPEDKLHYVPMSDYTRAAYNHLLTHFIIQTDLAEDPLVCDTTAKLRATLHMLEGGVCKIGKQYLQTKNREKIDYILEHWGDTEDLVIMYNYIEEEAKLRSVFKKATILQASSYAEGVDLSMYKYLVIYSQNWSTAQHTQRRARQANKLRSEPIIVHFLLMKKAISDQVYKTVAVNKKNFVDSVFKRDKV